MLLDNISNKQDFMRSHLISLLAPNLLMAFPSNLKWLLPPHLPLSVVILPSPNSVTPPPSSMPPSSHLSDHFPSSHSPPILPLPPKCPCLQPSPSCQQWWPVMGAWHANNSHATFLLEEILGNGKLSGKTLQPYFSYNPNLESFMLLSVQYSVIWLLVYIVPLAITTDSSCTKRCNMAFNVPMRHNKPNITYLIMYETCIHISQRPSRWYTTLCAYWSSHYICIFNFYTLCP